MRVGMLLPVPRTPPGIELPIYLGPELNAQPHQQCLTVPCQVNRIRFLPMPRERDGEGGNRFAHLLFFSCRKTGCPCLDGLCGCSNRSPFLQGQVAASAQEAGRICMTNKHS